MITPALTVLSAIEGIKLTTSALDHYVMPQLVIQHELEPELESEKRRSHLQDYAKTNFKKTAHAKPRRDRL